MVWSTIASELQPKIQNENEILELASLILHIICKINDAIHGFALYDLFFDPCL